MRLKSAIANDKPIPAIIINKEIARIIPVIEVIAVKRLID